MIDYSRFAATLAKVDPHNPEPGLTSTIVPKLVDAWVDDYHRSAVRPEVVQTTDSGFSYLFDIAAQRLVAAWGISHGRHGGARDASRMAGHPLSAGPLYHRGHAIPHTLGGPTDINLVPQLGKINVGPFRPLEKQAVATPGSLYFTYWRYPRGQSPATASQLPVGVDQGLFVAGQAPQVTRHGN